MKPRPLRTTALLLTLACAAGGLLGLRNLSAGERVEREFFISADPSIQVLKVRYSGGMAGTYTDHRVFSDGRFLVEIFNAINNEVIQKYETTLSYEQLHALIAIPVDGGVIEHKHERYEKELSLYRASDAGTISFELTLERYRGPDQEEWDPASFSLTPRGGVISAARRFPDVAAFQALATLIREVNTYREIAEAADVQE